MTTSSYCNWGDCVVVEHRGGGVWVWNTKTPGHQLWFSRDEWTVFLAGVRNGEFDGDDPGAA